MAATKDKSKGKAQKANGKTTAQPSPFLGFAFCASPFDLFFAFD